MSKDVETYIEELKSITVQLESGDLKLKEAVELYKQGSQAAAQAEKLLNQYESEIEVIDTTEIED